MIPFRTPFFLPYLYPSLTWKIPTDQKNIYLTFDDGPIAGPTEFVLDALQKASAKATFFCIGDNVRKYPEVFKRVLNSGNTVGNHTYNHLNGWKTDSSQYFQNVTLCEDEMRKAGWDPLSEKKLFRPPYGRVSRQQLSGLHNFNIIMWDVLTQDFSKTISPEKCLKESIRATRNGSIVLFHDSLKAEKNMSYVLPRYIDYFLAKGYQFNSIPL